MYLKVVLYSRALLLDAGAGVPGNTLVDSTRCVANP